MHKLALTVNYDGLGGRMNKGRLVRRSRQMSLLSDTTHRSQRIQHRTKNMRMNRRLNHRTPNGWKQGKNETTDYAVEHEPGNR
jgi:hypothetical protein